MGTGLLRRHVTQRVGFALAERPPGSGKNDFVDLTRPDRCIIGQGLKNGGMLAVNRQQLGATLHDGLHKVVATHHQCLLVGQQQTLAGPCRPQTGSQSGRPHDRSHHGIDQFMRCDHGDGRRTPENPRRQVAFPALLLQRAAMGLAGHDGKHRFELHTLLQHQLSLC